MLLPEDESVKAAVTFMVLFLGLSKEPKGSVFEPTVKDNLDRLVRKAMTNICESPSTLFVVWMCLCSSAIYYRPAYSCFIWMCLCLNAIYYRPAGSSPRQNVATMGHLLYQIGKIYGGKDLLNIFADMQKDDSFLNSSTISADVKKKFASKVMGSVL